KQIREKIAKVHNFSEEQLKVEQLTATHLPADIAVYRIEKIGSHGNIFFHYLFLDNRFYCSDEKQSFGQLLAAREFLTRRDLNTEQLIELFRFLAEPIRNARVLGLAEGFPP